jgi:glycogen synthase kinase 3 beta
MASTSQENAVSTSNITSVTRTEKSGYDQLPKEMHQMKIRDEKTTSHDEKVSFYI